MHKTYKKPNVKAPRFRQNGFNVMTNEFFKELKLKYPKYKDLSNSDIKAIVDISSRNIFRLLLHDKLKDNELNWKEILLLHLTVLQNGIDENPNLAGIDQELTDTLTGPQ